MIAKEKIVKRIEQQIRHCKKIDSDWISLTVEQGKRILELLEEKDDDQRAEAGDKMPHIHRMD